MGITGLQRSARTLAGVALVCATGVLWLATGTAAADSTIAVNTTQTTFTQGDGLCALGEAVNYADGMPEPDCSASAPSGTTTIDLPAGKYTAPGTLQIDGPTNIVGASASTSDLDGGGFEQVLNVASTATTTLSNLAVTGGMSAAPPSCTPTVGSPCSGMEGGNGGGIENAGHLTLDGVTVSGNRTSAGSQGSFQLQHSCVNCLAVPGIYGGDGGRGAGIYNAPGATLTVENSSITGNVTGNGAAGIEGFAGAGSDANGGAMGGDGGDGGSGAGIYNLTATVTINDSTVSGNSTGSGGAGGLGSNATADPAPGGNGGGGGYGGGAAGIENDGGSLSISGSTIADNTTGNGALGAAPGDSNPSGSTGTPGQSGQGGAGAGLDNFTNTATAIVDSTFAGNVAGVGGAGPSPGSPGEGGAIDNGDFGGTDLTDVTIAGNSAVQYSAIAGPGGRPLSETDSIIASNPSSGSGSQSCNPDQIVDGGHNVAYQASGCAGTTGDPKLAPLAANGGLTQTMALGPGSSALDLVPLSACTVKSDQRGLPRPAGPACDAGAYEVSPPTFSATSASASGALAISVTAQVTANLTDTKVAVRYGTSTAYGSTTATTDVGSGSATKPFAATLVGLAAGTTYHVQLVATNSDGTSSTGDMVVTTPSASTTSSSVIPHAILSRTTVSGEVLLVRLACAPGGGSCSGRLKLSSRVTTLHGKVVGVAARAAQRKRTKRKTVTRTVGSGSYSIAAGQTKVIRLTLNAPGKRLLKARRRLPALLTSSGAAQLSKRITFIYKRSRTKKH